MKARRDRAFGVGLTGACSNQPARPKIDEANRVRAKLVAAHGCASPASKPAPRSAPSTTAIVEVLRLSDEPLAIKDIVERVEQCLGRSVKRVSVKASLAEMAASPAHPVQRVARGRYVSRRTGRAG
jgi:hypothetical protein